MEGVAGTPAVPPDTNIVMIDLPDGVTSGAVVAMAKQDGVLRNHRLGPDGTPRDTVVFSILPHEWPAVRLGLQERLARG